MADIENSERLAIQVKGLQRGVLTYNTLYYYNVTDVYAETPAALIGAFKTDVQAVWLDIVSSSWTLLEYNVGKFNKVFTEYYTSIENVVGDNVGNVLPPYNTWSLVKIPDNAEIDPAGQTPFRQGRIGIAGVPEAYQDNGIPESVGAGLLVDLSNALEEFTSTSGDTWQMYMVRPATVIPAEGIARVPVLSIASGRMGTQNTRKS